MFTTDLLFQNINATWEVTLLGSHTLVKVTLLTLWYGDRYWGEKNLGEGKQSQEQDLWRTENLQ